MSSQSCLYQLNCSIPSAGPRLRYTQRLASIALEKVGVVSYLEPVRVFVSRPETCVGVEQEALFVFLADVVVEILCKGELAVELEIRPISKCTIVTIEGFHLPAPRKRRSSQERGNRHHGWRS